MAKTTLVIYSILLNISVCSIIQGVNNAGFILFRKIESDNDNTIYSPYSVGCALHSLLIGCSGSTNKQLSEFLQSPNDGHLEIEQSHKGLSRETENVRLSISNIMFHHHETQLAEQFLHLSHAHFNTSTLPLDFSDNNLEHSLQVINDQISSETNGKITNILSKDVITKDTRLVLVNILYFKGRWQNKFKKYNTKDREFHLDEYKHVMVPSMEQTEHFRYLENEDYQSAVLPFKDTSVEMVLYRPKHLLADLLHTILDHDRINQDYKQMSYNNVELVLPKFTVNNKYNLKETLLSLGLTHMFDDRLADFSKMTASGARELVLSEVLHNTYITIDEEGCEASAVSTSVMRLTRSAPSSEEPVKLHLNVPFIYVIRDRGTQTILFVGTQTHFVGHIIDRTEL